MESKYFIQVFPNGLGTTPRLVWTLEKRQFNLCEGMLTLTDPKTLLSKSFPTSIVIIDEVKA